LDKQINETREKLKKRRTNQENNKKKTVIKRMSTKGIKLKKKI